MERPETTFDPRQQLDAALQHYLGCRGAESLELEFRLGKVYNGRFVPGVSRTAFENLSRALSGLPSTTVITREHLCGSGQRAEKYVVTMQDSGVPAPPPPRWTTKERVFTLDFHGMRASMAYESWRPALASDIVPENFRHKTRTSFRGDIWTIDLTRVRSNLPEHRDETEEIYEVELELTDPRTLYDTPRDHVLKYAFKTLAELKTFAA